MSPDLFTLILFFGLKEVVSFKPCPSLSFPRHGTVKCLRNNETVNCGSKPIAGSIAEFSCQEFYKLSEEKPAFLECLSNGSWSSDVPTCIPGGFPYVVLLDPSYYKVLENARAKYCGRRGSSVSLIVNGAIASRGAFPWHVAIYNSIDGSPEYWCGGSLISETTVITAAHCTWKIPPEKLMVVFGKFHREFNVPEKTTQKIKVKKIEILGSYQDVAGNYNGDIAVVFLERPVGFGHYSAPVCIDWDQRVMDRHLAEGASGVVLGWGLTENDTFSDSLRMAKIPVLSDEICIAHQERDFKKFVTYTSFCAGFGNGTGVCNGDSGGGLSFFDEISGRWYLQGLVSVSPRRKGTFYCDPNFYAVFTKVGMFSKWIKKVGKLEEESLSPKKSHQDSFPKRERFRDFYAFVSKYSRKDYKVKGTKMAYPHSEKMLELVRLS